MILIVGNTHDDILYFESIMSNRKNERIFEKYDICLGTIFNQEVCLVHNVYTSYVSSAVVTYLINKYFVILTFVVGKCISFTNDLKISDIVISKQLYLADVDQVENAGTKLGQIPGFPQVFDVQSDVIEYLCKAFDKRTFSQYRLATLISSSVSYTDEDQLNEIKANSSLFGEHERVVLDSLSGGVAVACSLYNIPFISVEIVGRHTQESSSAKTYAKVLQNYISVGKAIVTCIGDIGRNDVIGAEGGE